MVLSNKITRTWYTPTGKYNRLCADILTQPHTLIAGTTGSGKSTVINAIMYAAMFRFPSQAQLVLIDTKRTELRQYKDLPHTAAYITEPAEAVRMFEKLIKIIQQRSETAAAQGLKETTEGDIYVIIDELGDLIFTDRRAVPILGRVAMIGRSAHVHLIAGTQCPNRKTLSPEFAANCPARVGLRCENKIESRQIIGTPDAVKLPLHGEGYYKAPQYLTPQLVQLPYYTSEELGALVQWWLDQKNAKPCRRCGCTPTPGAAYCGKCGCKL